MRWKIVSIASFVLIIPLMARWYADSSDMGKALIYSRDSKITETKHTDELLGTEVTETHEEKGFWLGLLPGTDSVSPGAIAGVIPIGSILALAGILGIIMNRRQKRKLSIINNQAGIV